MAYLNANIPVEYAQIRREYLYDLMNIMEKLKTVLSLVLAVLQVVLFYFTLSWRAVQYLSPSY